MFYFLGKMGIVAIAHVVVGVFFYYGRVKNLSPIFDSDLLAFLAPALLAFSGYLYVLWSGMPVTTHVPVKVGLVTSIAFVATAISCACTAIIAFNRFGT
jgi:hypothetical protein